MATSLYKAQSVVRTCDKHQHEEITCYCKDCKKYACTSCVKKQHGQHDWDLISSVAKVRRKETPKLCCKIKEDELSNFKKYVEDIDTRICTNTENNKRNIELLEYTRVTLIDSVNKFIENRKQQVEELTEKEADCLTKERRELVKRLDYVEKMTTALDSNIAAYSDFDLLEMEEEMLTEVEKLRTYKVANNRKVPVFLPGKIDLNSLQKIIGEVQEEDINVCQEVINSFKAFDSVIWTLFPTSETEAWMSAKEVGEIKLMSTLGKAVTRASHSKTSFIVLSNGDHIVVNYKSQTIGRVTSDGTETVLLSTKPLSPIKINMTRTEDILLNLADDGEAYKIQPHSRRLVQRMTVAGKVLNSYEFREDGTTRLFALPGNATENGNTDICVINGISSNEAELVVLYRDGRPRFTYEGKESGRRFNLRDVECDARCRIMVLNVAARSVHLLSPDGLLLGNILTDVIANDIPFRISLYGNSLWIGFADGTVKVCKYKTLN